MDLFTGTDDRGQQYLVTVHRNLAGQIIGREVATRPNPGSTWSPPVILAPAPGTDATGQVVPDFDPTRDTPPLGAAATHPLLGPAEFTDNLVRGFAMDGGNRPAWRFTDDPFRGIAATPHSTVGIECARIWSGAKS